VRNVEQVGIDLIPGLGYDSGDRFSLMDLKLTPYRGSIPNWPQRLEESFPAYPERDKKSAWDTFIETVYLNLQNHKLRNFDGPNSKFAWFYQCVKLANRRLRESTIFTIWLYLCIERPWLKAEFLLRWPGYSSTKNLTKIWDILEALNSKHEDISIRWDKGFSRFPPNESLRSMIIESATVGYSEWMNNRRLLHFTKKFHQLLKSGSVITKREIQRKLKISIANLDVLIEEDRRRGFIETRERPCKSTWVLWRQPRN
jgi:hypothetical protein